MLSSVAISHFMAIAWMYREDYDRAGYLVLPKGNVRIPFVILETLLPLLTLVAISIMQSPTRHAATSYCASGDLTKRKLIPGLYNLACEGCMNPQFEVLGIGRLLSR